MISVALFTIKSFSTPVIFFQMLLALLWFCLWLEDYFEAWLMHAHMRWLPQYSGWTQSCGRVCRGIALFSVHLASRTTTDFCLREQVFSFSHWDFALELCYLWVYSVNPGLISKIPKLPLLTCCATFLQEVATFLMTQMFMPAVGINKNYPLPNNIAHNHPLTENYTIFSQENLQIVYLLDPSKRSFHDCCS